MGVGDVRYTVLQTVNEVFRKLGLASVSNTAANKLSIQTVDFINDICNEMADAGDWQDMLVSANITAVSGQQDYSINTSANIHNIADLYFDQRKGPLRNVTVDDMRVLTRVTITGTPTQYCIFGTDANANPKIRVRPRPAASENGGIFSVLYFIRTPLYTTADDATVIPYPSRVVVLGVLAKVILNESGGAPDNKYQQVYQDYLSARKEGMNRFQGDTGWDISFVPSLISRRRR
jgi:hypothetical protein